MKKICLFILLTTMQVSFGGKKNQSEIPENNKNIVVQLKNGKNSLAIKEEISWGILSGVVGYLGYRVAKKCGYGLPLSWDQLSIGVSFTLGAIGLGLLDYTYHTSHRVHAMLEKEDYVTGALRQKGEKSLSDFIEESEGAHTSLHAMYTDLKEIY